MQLPVAYLQQEVSSYKKQFLFDLVWNFMGVFLESYFSLQGSSFIYLFIYFTNVEFKIQFSSGCKFRLVVWWMVDLNVHSELLCFIVVRTFISLKLVCNRYYPIVPHIKLLDQFITIKLNM